MVKFCDFIRQKMLFLEGELPLTLTQNYVWWPYAFFIFLNYAYLNAHSVKKWKLSKYNEVDKTPSLKRSFLFKGVLSIILLQFWNDANFV
jgi:hypothetical protein